MNSPTGYWAHYTTRWKRADGTRGETWTDSYPVIGYTDVALVLDSDGVVRTVEALREILAADGAQPDPEGETYRVSFEVNPHNGE